MHPLPPPLPRQGQVPPPPGSPPSGSRQSPLPLPLSSCKSGCTAAPTLMDSSCRAEGSPLSPCLAQHRRTKLQEKVSLGPTRPEPAWAAVLGHPTLRGPAGGRCDKATALTSPVTLGTRTWKRCQPCELEARVFKGIGLL